MRRTVPSRLVLSAGALALVLLAGCRPYGTICGDGICEGSETAATCPGDCGPPVCGDGVCRASESCSGCPSDCGACPVCGDGVCNGSDTCSSCVADCGTCPVCGDGVCRTGETCSSCASDCGSCGPVCGNGICESPELCSSCSTDCGSCGGFAQPYEACTRDSDCSNARDRCFFVTNRGVTRGFCTVIMCPGASTSADDVCDFDMFSARGDCLAFPGGDFNCYHRCVDRSDCYPGFGCYTPTGAIGSLTNVCLPE